ncbi:MAG: YcaO-like family protein [Myxococcaceae bacterium]|nr:YcaO-like family protein [Myxococcaceae bacterium]MCI0673611.1 YcaO-like family protein [Myxococcaceae bacterium]
MGVTRIARVTGLDRTGVEVACAIRPEGHILQVSNGKGRTFAEAARGALSEAAELWAAEHPDPVALRWGTEEELRRHAGEDSVFGPEALGVEALLPGEVRTTWCPAKELVSGHEVWVPASVAYCPPPDGPYLGPAIVTWTSNGLAAHPDLEEARVRALLEAAERHLLALTLPEGFTPEVVRRYRVARETLTALAPRLASPVRAMEGRGFAVELFALTLPKGPGRVQLPLAAALLFDEEEGPHPVTAGYACRTTLSDALESALFEAAQSRLTDIHGAREDIAPPDRDAARMLRQMCRDSKRRARAQSLPSELRGARPQRALMKRLTDAGFPRVAFASLSPPRLGLHVVKAVVPGFLRSELL